MYYTIQDGQILTAETGQVLMCYYDWAKPLPSDYEVGKYIVENDKLVLNTHFEEEQALREKERNANLKLTKREVFLALYKDLGITPEQIKNKLSSPEALIEFEYANEYYRGNPLIDYIGLSLGYSKEKLDYLFQNKSFDGFDSAKGGEKDA